MCRALLAAGLQVPGRAAEPPRGREDDRGERHHGRPGPDAALRVPEVSCAQPFGGRSYFFTLPLMIAGWADKVQFS